MITKSHIKQFSCVLFVSTSVISAASPESVLLPDGGSHVEKSSTSSAAVLKSNRKELLQWFDEYLSLQDEGPRRFSEYFRVWFSPWLQKWLTRRFELPKHISHEHEVVLILQHVNEMSHFLTFRTPVRDNHTDDISMDPKTGSEIKHFILTSSPFCMQMFLIASPFYVLSVKCQSERLLKCKNIGIMCAAGISLFILSWFADSTELVNSLTNSCASLSGFVCGSIYFSTRSNRKQGESNRKSSTPQ